MAFREIDDDLREFVQNHLPQRSRISGDPGVTRAGHEKSKIFLTGGRWGVLHVFNGILYVLTTRFPSPTPGGNRSTPSWRRGLSRPPHTSRCSNVVSSYLRCSRSLRSFLEDLRSSRTPVPQLAPSVLELLPRKRFAFSHAPGRSL